MRSRGSVRERKRDIRVGAIDVGCGFGKRSNIHRARSISRDTIDTLIYFSSLREVARAHVVYTPDDVGV